MKTTHVKAMSCLLCCAHCAHEQVADAMPAENMLDVLRGFLLMHRRCEKPVEPSKQSSLFDALSAKEQALFQKDEHPERSFSAIDTSTDEPAPEIGPPGHDELDADGNPLPPPAYPQWSTPPVDDYAAFARRYPPVETWLRLTATYLMGALLPAQYAALPAKEPWPPSSVAFQEAAHWARLECAHQDSTRRGIAGSVAGLTIPARLPMPEALKKLLEPPKKKRAGARPLSSPSAALPAVASVKKTRKRRSGSTQHID